MLDQTHLGSAMVPIKEVTNICTASRRQQSGQKRSVLHVPLQLCLAGQPLLFLILADADTELFTQAHELAQRALALVLSGSADATLQARLDCWRRSDPARGCLSAVIPERNVR